MRTRTNQNDDVAPDMTPMIDCVFLLLIFFLVATTLKKFDRELPLELPDAATAVDVKAEPDTLMIGVDADGILYLDGELATVQQLHDRLQQLSKTAPETHVRLDADKAADYQHVLHVIDQLTFWGLKNIGFHVRRENAVEAGGQR